MHRPDFIIVGAAKSGTTSFARYLDAHPSINIVGERLEFFGEYSNPRYRDIDPATYYDMMNVDGTPDILVGEKSVSYLYSKAAVNEIAVAVPNVKIIVLLRNPVDRAYSDYWHRVRTGVEKLSFSDALDAEPERIKDGARFELHYATYGLYSEHLKMYLEAFGRERVQILFHEDLKNRPDAVIADTCKFLGVTNPSTEAKYLIHNKGGGQNSLPVRIALRAAQNSSLNKVLHLVLPNSIKSALVAFLVRSSSAGEYPKMKEEDKKRLLRFYDSSISNLEEMTGRDLSQWRSI